jgi:hypothetical protein
MACVRVEIPNSKNQIPTKLQKPSFKTQRGSVIDISLLELGIYLDSGSWNLEFAGASGSVRHWLLQKAGLGLGSMNTRLLGILAVIVVAICIGAMWFLNSTPPVPVVVTPPITPAPATSAPATPEPVRPIPRDTPKIAARTESTPAKPTERPQPPATKPMADWEIKIDQVLQTNADESQTAQMLINLLPTLPPEGQEEAAQHISNLILDKDYNKVAALVKNPGLPEDVLDVFVTDLMNREDEVKLPILLDIAKIPNHPHHEEAVTDLQIFLDEDYGKDWTKWEAAMKSYLQRQVAENAAAEKEAADEKIIGK